MWSDTTVVRMVSASYLKQQVSNNGKIVCENSMMKGSASDLPITFINIGMAKRHQQFDTTQVATTNC